MQKRADDSPYVRGRGHTKRSGGQPVGHLPTVGEVTVGWWHCTVCRRRTRWVGPIRRTDDTSSHRQMFCNDCGKQVFLKLGD